MVCWNNTRGYEHFPDDPDTGANELGQWPHHQVLPATPNGIHTLLMWKGCHTYVVRAVSEWREEMNHVLASWASNVELNMTWQDAALLCRLAQKDFLLDFRGLPVGGRFAPAPLPVEEDVEQNEDQD